jgi:hypothetical protein
MLVRAKSDSQLFDAVPSNTGRISKSVATWGQDTELYANVSLSAGWLQLHEGKHDAFGKAKREPMSEIWQPIHATHVVHGYAMRCRGSGR